MFERPVVMKFGGTSVEDAAAIRRVAAIAHDRRAHHPVVVTSAMAKVTDSLVELCSLALSAQLDAAVALIQSLRQRHRQTLAELADGPGEFPCASAFRADSEALLDARFDDLAQLVRGIAALGELTPRTRDAVLSFGERLSPILVCMAIERTGQRSAHVDARKIIVTDDQFTRALPQYAETQYKVDEQLKPLLAAGYVPVLGGFIAATRDGVGTTLGRGGSDFSASILGAALEAGRIEIWTDVDGMLTADPRACHGARRIKSISFQEAAELAYFGAKVLHPATLLPAMQKNIPVWVLNSRSWLPGPPDGEKTGTLIASRAGSSPRSPFKCISTKRKIAVIDVVSTRMLMAHGFLKAIWDVFDKYRCPVDMVSTSEVSVSLTVSETQHLPQIADELGRFAEVRYEGRKAILCLVGESIREIPGLAARVFAAMGDINIRMISQGASEINIGMVIEDDDVAEAMRRLHETFFSDVDPALFA
jgi:aspartate kinase